MRVVDLFGDVVVCCVVRVVVFDRAVGEEEEDSVNRDDDLEVSNANQRCSCNVGTVDDYH